MRIPRLHESEVFNRNGVPGKQMSVRSTERIARFIQAGILRSAADVLPARLLNGGQPARLLNGGQPARLLNGGQPVRSIQLAVVQNDDVALVADQNDDVAFCADQLFDLIEETAAQFLGQRPFLPRTPHQHRGRARCCCKPLRTRAMQPRPI